MARYPIKINEFKIDDADVTYVDQDASKPLHLTHLNLLAGNIRNIRSPNDTSSSSDAAYHVGLALEQQGLGRDALQVWENLLEQAPSASVNERPFFNKVRQRIAQLRAQLTTQDGGFRAAPIASSAQSSAPKVAY